VHQRAATTTRVYRLNTGLLSLPTLATGHDNTIQKFAISSAISGHLNSRYLCMSITRYRSPILQINKNGPRKMHDDERIPARPSAINNRTFETIKCEYKLNKRWGEGLAVWPSSSRAVPEDFHPVKAARRIARRGYVRRRERHL
jgi:hypothetical protein